MHCILETWGYTNIVYFGMNLVVKYIERAYFKLTVAFLATFGDQ